MLLSESKALQNLGISIPDSAKCLLAQVSVNERWWSALWKSLKRKSIYCIDAC